MKKGVFCLFLICSLLVGSTVCSYAATAIPVNFVEPFTSDNAGYLIFTDSNGGTGYISWFMDSTDGSKDFPGRVSISISSRKHISLTFIGASGVSMNISCTRVRGSGDFTNYSWTGGTQTHSWTLDNNINYVNYNGNIGTVSIVSGITIGGYQFLPVDLDNIEEDLDNITSKINTITLTLNSIYSSLITGVVSGPAHYAKLVTDMSITDLLFELYYNTRSRAYTYEYSNEDTGIGHRFYEFYQDWLEANNMELEQDTSTLPESGSVANQREQEEALMGNLTPVDSSDFEIDISGDNYDFTWGILENIVSVSTKLLAVFVMILSIGIIKLVLNR